MRDFRKFCRPKIKNTSSVGDIILKLKCGTTGTISQEEYNKVKQFFKLESFVGESTSSPGKIKAESKLLGEEAIFDIATYQIIEDSFEIKEIVGDKKTPADGDIICHNSILNRDATFSFQDWLNVDDSWEITGLYNIETFEEEDTVGGEYVILANGTTLIIKAEDYSKVSSNWEKVDEIPIPHEYVDLGLPSGTKWATMNVGASSETDYGNYYQYGKGTAQYSATSGDSNYSGTEDPLDSSVDTAAQVWGGSWHMPTRAQMEELTANTTYQWVTNYKGSGINGGTFTATNGAVLFFPAAGYWDNGSQFDVGNDGDYWGSSPNGSYDAYGLNFGNGGKDVNYGSREYGFSVRAVLDE